MERDDILDEDFSRPKQKSYNETLVRIILILEVFFLLLGNAAAYFEMETIVFSGSLVLIGAVILFVLFWLRGNALTLVISIYSMILIALMFLTIFLYELGPSEAQRKLLLPLTFINVPFCILFFLLIIRQVIKKRNVL